MGRGIRHRYAVSALLLVLLVEFLVIEISDTQEIK